MKHLISTICSSHRNDHETSSIDCDLHKLINIILCELRNLKDLLSLSRLILINNILSGVLVLAIIAFYDYLTFYVAFLLHRIVLYSVCTMHVPHCRNPAFWLQHCNKESSFIQHQGTSYRNYSVRLSVCPSVTTRYRFKPG